MLYDLLKVETYVWYELFFFFVLPERTGDSIGMVGEERGVPRLSLFHLINSRKGSPFG